MVEATDAATAVQFQIRAVGRFENLEGESNSSILSKGLLLFLKKSAVQSWCAVVVFALVGQQ